MSSISKIAYLVLALAIGYAFVYSPFGEVSALLDQKQTHERTLEMVNTIENKKNELLIKFEAIPEEEKKDIETILPDSFDFVKLISQIDAVAASHGISIESITSKEISSAVGTSVESAAPAKTYKSSVIGFSFTASYERFNEFIADLEKSLRILDIRSAKLTSEEQSGLYSYDVEFETYWLK